MDTEQFNVHISDGTMDQPSLFSLLRKDTIFLSLLKGKIPGIFFDSWLIYGSLRLSRHYTNGAVSTLFSIIGMPTSPIKYPIQEATLQLSVFESFENSSGPKLTWSIQETLVWHQLLQSFSSHYQYSEFHLREVVARPEASASTGNFLEIRKFGPHSTPHLLNQKLYGWGPASCVLTSIPDDSDAKVWYLLKALILIRHVFINEIWKFRLDLMGDGGK